MDAETRKTLEALAGDIETNGPTAALARDAAAIRAALAEVDALTQQVADLEARAIPKAWVEKATVDLTLRGVTRGGDVAMIRGRDGTFRFIDFGSDETPREFPTLSAALSAAKESL